MRSATSRWGAPVVGLSESRTQVVFSDGAPDARLMVVGEAPGANEDETGLPFVGAAGKFLDLLLATVGLSREESVYICNVLKCRPPGNRNPEPGRDRGMLAVPPQADRDRGRPTRSSRSGRSRPNS